MVTSRTFRIFVSSTFSDMKEERNALQKNVFPKLRELCEKNGYRFQAIDLRWGVSQEAGYDQQTVRICLEEIARCQRVTPRPNFIILLGNKYGWRPLPAEIPATEFEMLKDKITNSVENDLLEKWYRRDDNAVPAVYCLQPRVTDEERNRDSWTGIERTLHRALMDAASQCKLSDDALLKYNASATEQEIINGALDIGDAKDHVFGFFRNIDGLPYGASARNFIDLDTAGNPDENGWKDSQRLKETVQNALGKKNVKLYTATWIGNNVTYDHIPKICDDVYSSLKDVIEAQIANLQLGDELEKEILEHDAFGNERVKHFVGRKDLLHEVSEYLETDNLHPLAIHGDSGSGKTAFMARVVEETRVKKRDSVIVSRFIGATASSTSIPLLLESLCTQISRGYSPDIESVPKEYEKLANEFPARLRLATSDKPLIIFLDALDQLSLVDQGGQLSWFPPTLPDNVKIIVSVLPGENFTVLGRMLPVVNIKKIEPMAVDEGQLLLDSWLEEMNRTLQPWQNDEVISKFTKNGLPLYLKLAFEEARRWKSYSPECKLSNTIPGILQENLLERLSSKTNHGPKIVFWSLGFLAASRYGLAEDELIDIISSSDTEVFEEFKRCAFSVEDNVQTLPVIIWSRLYFDLEPYLMERSVHGVSLLTFYHCQIAKTIEKEFVNGNAKMWHGKLADYFSARPHGERKVDELPWQLQKAEERERLKNCISDIETFRSWDSDAKKYELMGYWRFLHNRYDMTDSYAISFREYEKNKNPEQEKIAHLLHDLAGFFALNARYIEAEPLLRRELEITEKISGPEDAATGNSLSNLAGLMVYRGKFSEAEKLYGRALAIQEKVLDQEHKDIAFSLNNLAWLYTVESQFSGVINWRPPLFIWNVMYFFGFDYLEAYLQKFYVAHLEGVMLASVDKLIGEEHPDDAIRYLLYIPFLTGFTVFVSYFKTGSFFRKIIATTCIAIFSGLRWGFLPILQFLLKISIIFDKYMNEKMGSVFNDAATARDDLAIYTRRVSKLSEAEPLLRRALSIREKVLGPNHPLTATSLNDLAGVLWILGGEHIAEAELLFRHALSIREKVLGPDHPLTATSLNNLAYILQGKGEYVEAEQLFRRALSIREKVLGPDHSDTVKSLYPLAVLLCLESIDEMSKATNYPEWLSNGSTKIFESKQISYRLILIILKKNKLLISLRKIILRTKNSLCSPSVHNKLHFYPL